MLKCNPITCLGAFFVINLALFGWIKLDLTEIRKEVFENNKLFMSHILNIAKIAPTSHDLAFKVLLPQKI